MRSRAYAHKSRPHRRWYRHFSLALTAVFLLSLVAPALQGGVPVALGSPQNPGCYYPSAGQAAATRSQLIVGASGRADRPAVASEPATAEKIGAQFSATATGGLPSPADPVRALDEAGYPADVEGRIAKWQADVAASGTPETYPEPRPLTPEEAAIGPLAAPPGGGASAQAGYGSIAGQVFNDSNGDGQPTGESLLDNIVVDFISRTIFDEYGRPLSFRAVSNTSGIFGVSNWPAGDVVTIYAYVPPGRTVSTYANGRKTNLQSVVVPLNAVQPLWAIGLDPIRGGLVGHVFNDTNGNGIQDGGETNRAGLPVYVNSWEDNILQTVTTDGNGNFKVFVPYGNTTAFTIQIPALTTVSTGNVLQFGTVPRGADGYATPIGLDPTTGTAAGRVYDDANGNGVQDGGEPGKANVTVYLFSSDYFLRSTTTNASGDFSVTVPYGNQSTVLSVQVPGSTFVTSANNQQYVDVPRGGTGTARQVGLLAFSAYGANNIPGAAVSTTVRGINDAGVMIGSGNGTGKSFIYYPPGHTSKQRPSVVVAGCGGPGMAEGDSLARPLDALSPAPEAPSDAIAVNDSDAVAGSSRDDSGRQQATVWPPEPESPPVNPVASQGYPSSEANDINNSGRVVGEGESNGQQAFAVDSNGGNFVSIHNFVNNQVGNIQETVANAINDQQIAVGAYTKGGRKVAYAAVASPGNTAVKDLGLTSTPLNNYNETEGVLINNHNQIVIEARQDGRQEVWLHTIPGTGGVGGGGPVKIGDGTAVSINNAGQVVWDDVNHTRHVYDIKAGIDITPLMPSGTKIWGINNNGRAAGDSPASGPVQLAPLSGTRTLTLSVPGGNGTISASPGGPTYPAGTLVTITANGDGGRILQGWKINGQPMGWANPLPLPMNDNYTVEAVFTPLYRFNDVPADHPAANAIAQLATRGVIRGYEGGLEYGPEDLTLRAQMAALIARAMVWTGDANNPFTDKCDPADPAYCVDDELWRAVGQLASRSVARGYTDPGTCSPAGTPCYAPRDNVLYAQTISFITRAMVAQGYWAQQPVNANIYGGVLNGTGHEQDVTTFVHYAGTLPQAGPVEQPWAGWNQPSTRGWFALALWQALDSYWGR